jgi:GAF domain-containing protein
MAVRNLTPCDAMAIFIHDVRTDELVVHHAAGIGAAALHGRRVSDGADMLDTSPAQLDRRMLTVAREAAPKASSADTIRSCCAVPLVYEDCPLGVVALYGTRPHAFESYHQGLIEVLASSLAGSVASVLEVEDLPPVRVAPPPPQPAGRPTHLRLVPRP